MKNPVVAVSTLVLCLVVLAFAQLPVKIVDGTGTEKGTIGNPMTTSGSFTSIVTGQQAVTASAVALTTITTRSVCVKALDGNSTVVYIGPSGVTTGTGMELGAGESFCSAMPNTNVFYVIAAGTGNAVSWIGTN